MLDFIIGIMTLVVIITVLTYVIPIIAGLAVIALFIVLILAIIFWVWYKFKSEKLFEKEIEKGTEFYNNMKDKVNDFSNKNKSDDKKNKENTYIIIEKDKKDKK